MGHICGFKQTTIDNRASVKMESPLFVLRNTPTIKFEKVTVGKTDCGNLAARFVLRNTSRM